MSDQLKKNPPSIHIKVKVTAVTNPANGATEYVQKFDPEVIPVTENDTLLVFKLVKPTPDDVIVTGVKPVQEGNTQLSKPSISQNGKTVVIIDDNTTKETLNLNFTFGPAKSSSRLAMAACNAATIYPEIENEPPVP